MAGICLLLALVVTAGIISHHLLLQGEKSDLNVSDKNKTDERKSSAKTSSSKRTGVVQKQKKTSISSVPVKSESKTPPPDKIAAPRPLKKPKYEIFPEKDFSPQKGSPQPPPVRLETGLPKVAIIIDDLGYDLKLAKKFIEIDRNFTFSVIPSSPFHLEVARMVRNKGGELMLHLPMEPDEYPAIDPGPGALLTKMSPDELIGRLRENIESIPGIKGVNGHMGSRITANYDQMNQIFTILKRESLYFVDSYTSPRSVCWSSAKLLKVPFARRDVFIDHLQDRHSIRAQIKRLVKLARQNGEAVGIAHPHQSTIEILEEIVPDLRKKVELTPASKLARIIG